MPEANPNNILFVGRNATLINVKRKESKIKASKKPSKIIVK